MGLIYRNKIEENFYNNMKIGMYIPYCKLDITLFVIFSFVIDIYSWDTVPTVW